MYTGKNDAYVSLTLSKGDSHTSSPDHVTSSLVFTIHKDETLVQHENPSLDETCALLTTLCV